MSIATIIEAQRSAVRAEETARRVQAGELAATGGASAAEVAAELRTILERRFGPRP